MVPVLRKSTKDAVVETVSFLLRGFRFSRVARRCTVLRDIKLVDVEVVLEVSEPYQERKFLMDTDLMRCLVSPSFSSNTGRAKL